MGNKEKINNLISELKEISDNHLRRCNMDEECDHSRADDILIEIIKELGYSEVEEYFDNIHKWYS